VRRQARFFPVTRSAINKRLERLTAPLNLTVPVSPHTFRHSFAVNAVLHGTPLPVLQGWLGHADIASTLIYTRVLTLETHHLMRRIQF
jgi:site-specific recombinase XerD